MGYHVAVVRPTSPGESRAHSPQVRAPVQPEHTMAKPNYAFEKRQRELEKKRKKEEKAARKTAQLPVPSTALQPDPK